MRLEPLSLSTQSLPQLHYPLSAKDVFFLVIHNVITSLWSSMFMCVCGFDNEPRLYCPHCSLKLSSESCNTNKHSSTNTRQKNCRPSADRCDRRIDGLKARVVTMGAYVAGCNCGQLNGFLIRACYWKDHCNIALQNQPISLV